MKSIPLIVLSIIFSTSLFAQNVSVKDYDVPVSTAKTLRFNGSWNWAQIVKEDSTRVTSNNASGSLLFRAFYSSLPFAWFIDVDASGSKNFDEYNHSIYVAPSIRKYLWDDKDWFGFGSLELRHRDEYEQVESYATTGFGFGRYINATSLAKAVRIEEHLMEDGVLSDYLPKDAMLNIAKIIDREEEYINRYGDTYETAWYEDIEKEIIATGMLEEGSVGAIGIIRMQQVLFGINERVNERYYGWDVSLGMRYHISSADGGETSSPALSVTARYSYPITWRDQINAYANFNTPLDSTFFDFVNANVGIDYFYELSNKINFVFGYRIDLTQPIRSDSYLNHTLTSSFLFYLENQIYLGINGNLSRNGLIEQTDLSTSVSIQYNLF